MNTETDPRAKPADVIRDAKHRTETAIAEAVNKELGKFMNETGCYITDVQLTFGAHSSRTHSGGSTVVLLNCDIQWE